MKVLILSVTAGYGHHAAAAAVSSALEQRGVETKTVDLLKYCSRPMYGLISGGYYACIKLIPKPYGKMYNHGSRRSAERVRTPTSRIMRLICRSKLLKLLKEFGPDAVVCSHVIAALVLDSLNERGIYKIPTVGLLTDYMFHPYWEDVKSIDYIVTPTELLEPKALRRGILPEKLVPLGIPINPKFLHSMPKEKARLELGLEPDKFTILCIGGSMGYGDMESSLRALDGFDAEFQTLCVCGSNQKMENRLRKVKFKKRVDIYGFVNNVDIMMDAADCIVTKPGGLTTAEAMAKQVPMIIANPIPGQEERNAEFLAALGVAVNCGRDFPVPEAIWSLTHAPERLEEMRASLARMSKPNSTENIAELVVGLVEEKEV